jgi:hypothetical protein
LKLIQVSTIIDDKNKFILITLKLDNNYTIKFKDSYRIFPVSLESLCKVFQVEGKISKYNVLFNNINLFDNISLLNQFIEYSIQDSISLQKALCKAQEIYSDKYSVDITSILSTSTLSLKIFRQQFLKTNIPILSGTKDNFIRKSYFGGATDYYKAYATKLFYYDVNSLYPFAMLKPMPHELIDRIKDMSNVNLKDFFGFCLAEITTNSELIRPILPYKYDGKTIYPKGKWIGTYFSEELKAVEDKGYTIKLIEGYEFSKTYLFKDYIDHFYSIKQLSIGAER